MGEPHPLLELQRLDLEVDGLRARRAALPERAAGAAREATLAALAPVRDELETRRGALGRAEREAEEAASGLETKAREVESRLYSGEVKAIKELEALQHELGEWRRRQGAQEGEALALMEREEGLAGELAELGARRTALEAERATLSAAVATAEAEIDAVLGRLLEARAAALGQLEAAIVARYEMLRAAPPIKGRAAVPILAGGACGGCRTALPIAFAAGLHGRPAGETTGCPHCGRILVL